jgi:hypothetical protein
VHNLNCCLCERNHTTFKELKDHLGQHLDDFRSGYRYVCSECGTSFVHHFELLAHREAVKRLTLEKGRCNWCGQTFDSLSVEDHATFRLHLTGSYYAGSDQSRLCYDKRIYLGLGLFHRLNKQIDSLIEV